MHQPGLSADLDSFDLLDLVQVIQMTRRNLSLVVRSGAQRLGLLRFAQGELLWAEFGALRGSEAFIALAAQHSGSVEELAWDGHEERNVSQPLSRLVMQAVQYRDAHDTRPPVRQPEPDSRSRPLQPASTASRPIQPFERSNGLNGSSRLGAGLAPSEALEPEEDDAPAWIREIHPAGEPHAATPLPPSSSAPPPAFSPPPQPSLYLTQTEPLNSPPPGSGQPMPSSLLREEMAVEIPEPTVPLATPNGKFSLPSLANGNRPAVSSLDEAQDDPPTVPLPSIQGSLRAYAARRELPAPEHLREAPPGTRLTMNPLPEQAVSMRPAPAVAVAPQLPITPPEPPPPPTAPAEPVAPPAEPKLSSLAILEQLAYGGSFNGGADAAAFEAPAPSAAPLSAAPVLSSPTVPAVAPVMVEGMRSLEQALEAFADQVGNACVATAIIRSDGKLLAEYKARHSQDQDLASPAYHMAHVMQASLRALLMGGWGDLDDTFITGSTHSVMLRRLGRAEKGLFHIAVLERSGNPGLCRVRMRNSEAALLQLVSVDLPTTAS